MTLRGAIGHAHITKSLGLGGNGTFTVVPAVASHRIRVLAMTVEASGSGFQITLQDSAGTPKILLDRMQFIDAEPMVWAFSEDGFGETASGESLDVVMDTVSAGTASLSIIYGET